jgi:hypothetical protein
MFFTPSGGAPATIGLSAVQSTQATAAIPAALLTSAGTAQVALANAVGISSNQLQLVVGEGLAPQTIVFEALFNQLLDTPPFPIDASASSGLAVSQASNTPSACALSGGTVTLVAVEYCSITATQTGNSDYSTAPPVTRSFDVTAPVGPSGTLVQASGSPLTAGQNPVSVAVGDFNGDGIPDLVAANYINSTLSVQMGNVTGGFVPTTGSPIAVGTNHEVPGNSSVINL